MCIVVFYKNAIQQIEIAFAFANVKIFEEITISTEENVDPYEISGYLSYVIWYYPSGTRQKKDSPLDKMIEMDRSHAIKNIITRLRVVTGKDLGSDPQKWIAEYPPLATHKKETVKK